MRRVIEEELPDEVYQPAPVLSAAEETAEHLIAQYAQDGIIVKVFDELNGDERYLWTIKDPTPEAISEEAIRRRNKGRGGAFILKMFVGGERKAVWNIHIADDPDAAPVSSGSEVSILREELRMLREDLRRPQASEPMSEVVKATTALISAQSQMLLQKTPETPLDQLLKLHQAISEIKSGPVEDDSVMGIVKDMVKGAAPALIPLLAGFLNKAGAVPASVAAPVQAVALPEAKGEAMPEKSDELRARQEAELRAGLNYLKKQCMKGAYPETYIGMICENAEDFQALLYLAANEEFSYFVALDPEIGKPPYNAFVRSIYDGLRQYNSSTDSVDEDTAGARGDKPNTSGNGATRKRGNK
jgi:hypothetical protein